MKHALRMKKTSKDTKLISNLIILKIVFTYDLCSFPDLSKMAIMAYPGLSM